MPPLVFKMIVYDIEIINAIPPKNGGERVAGVRYCDGWHDLFNMGISVICAYDSKEDEYRVFLQDNFDQFQRLVERDMLVAGFNSISFDDRVCRDNGIYVDTRFDLLRATYSALGLDPWPSEYTEEYKGRSLDAMARANGLNPKTGSGALAPVLWQQGKLGTVIDYCLHDVEITRCLLDRIDINGCLIDPVTADTIYYDDEFEEALF